MCKPLQHTTKIVAALVLAFSGLFTAEASAAPITSPFEYRFISGTSIVKSHGPGVVAGWEARGFDDTGWDNARMVPAPQSPTYPIPFGHPPRDTQARYIWHDPAATSNGKNGVNEAFFRFDFGLPALSGRAFPYEAILSIVADDDFEFWLNGAHVATEADFGTGNDRGPDYIYRYDVTSRLLLGDANVLAVHATDGSLTSPSDQLYEHLAFQLRIRTVPEPGSLALLIPALLGMGFLGKRKQ
ncbi:hypothetical protein HNQ59_003124 [Chitinivorax tropicus]|uniref:PEP-CTERM sorting domain-containing protein n=1 Tax=Chitinivorax tropicus TaxID=714531 RepID=A0A840MTX3_9PROT|nr:PEP-CTERM sorting domain-containing protein [Chitinivorax tropicus]MBB5019816.1 hypothetical protein [Chitinivorax tropicus]